MKLFLLASVHSCPTEGNDGCYCGAGTPNNDGLHVSSVACQWQPPHGTMTQKGPHATDPSGATRVTHVEFS